MPIKDPFDVGGVSGIVDPFDRGVSRPYSPPKEPELEGPPQAPVSVGEALGRGASQGVALGWGDEVAGLREAGRILPAGVEKHLAGSATGEAYQALAQPLIGAARLGYDYLTGGDGAASKAYEKRVEEERARNRQVQKERPFSYGAGELVGAGVLPMGAAMQGATLPVRIARGAKVGATIGAVQGVGEGETASERVSGGVGGGLGGAGVGAALPVGIAAAKGVAGIGKGVIDPYISAARGWINPDKEASRQILNMYRRSADIKDLGLSPAEWAAAKSAGKPVVVADLLGSPGRALARSAANTSPEADAALKRIVNDRFEGQASRAEEAVRGLVRTPANVTVTQDALDAAMRTARKPFYNRAYQDGAGGYLDADLQRTYNESPLMQGAFKDAISSIQNKMATGRAQPPVNPQTGMPTLEFWDQVQRTLRDKHEVLKRAGEKEAAGDADAIRRQLVNKLDAAFPSFAVARGVAAKLFDAVDALDAGRKFVKSGRVDDVLKIRNKMTPEERMLFAEGFASDYIDNIRKLGDRRSILNKLQRSTDDRARLEAALGPQAAKELETFLRTERVMDMLRGAVTGNSTTAKQIAEMGLAGGLGTYAWTGDLGSASQAAALASSFRYGSKILGQRINQKVAQKVGEQLASNDLRVLRQGLQTLSRNPKLVKALEAVEDSIIKAGGLHAPKGFIPFPPQSLSTVGAEEDKKAPGRAEGGGVADPFDPLRAPEGAAPSVEPSGLSFGSALDSALKSNPITGIPYSLAKGVLSSGSAFKEGLEKGPGAMLRGYGEALENQYVPEGAVGYTDAGEWLDKEGNVLPSQYRPNVLPVTQAAKPGEGWFGSNYEGAMPAMLDVWNTFNAPTKAASVAVAAAKAGSEGKAATQAGRALQEGQDAYHGTPTPTFERFRVGTGDERFSTVDRELGVHVAKDPEISNTFTVPGEKGGLYPVRIPDDAKFLELPQRERGWDSFEVERMVMKHAYQKDPAMLARYLVQARGVPTDAAEDVAGALLRGESIKDHGRSYDLDSFIESFGGLPYNTTDRRAATEMFRQDMMDQGYAGIKYRNTSPGETKNAKDPTSYIVFDPHKTIQNRLTGAFMSDSGAEGRIATQAAQSLRPENAAFYSAAERTVEGAKQSKTTPEQWVNWLRNQPGVTKDEIEHLGLEDWAKSTKGAVSKEDFLQHLKNNQLELKQEQFGGGPDPVELKKAVDKAFDKFMAYARARGYGVVQTPEQVRSSLEKQVRADPFAFGLPIIRNTRYQDWTLPGGANYRELVYTFPQKPSPVTAAQLDKDSKQIFGQRFEELSASQQAEIRDFTSSRESAGASSAPYTHNHWPGVENPLYHLRVNDREIPGVGNTLHLEELQSDWHQTGREQGYKGQDFNKLREQRAQAFEVLQEAHLRLKKEHPDAYGLRQEHLWEADPQYVGARQQLDVLEKALAAETQGVPDAPFKKSWAELGLRNALIKAVQEGKDAISWTPGAEQAKRYDLSKHIDQLKYLKNDNGTYNIVPFKGGAPVHSIEKANVEADELAALVGKDVADKIIKNEGKREGKDIGVLEGLDLQVGGGGMKAFYDKMLVNKMNDLGKKYGAKVEWMPLQGPKWAPAADDIFEVRGGLLNNEPGVYATDFGGRRIDDGWYHIDEDGETPVGPFKSRDEVLKKFDTAPLSAPVFKIPEKMRQDIIQKGLPLFAESGAEGKAASQAGQALREPQHSNVESLGPYREKKKLEGFHSELGERVRSRAQEMAKLGAQYHEEGKLPFPVGTRFTTEFGRKSNKPPVEVKGYYVDSKNPEKYGYYVERGRPGDDDWEKSIYYVNDPKRPEVKELAEQFKPFGGPMRVFADAGTKGRLAAQAGRANQEMGPRERALLKEARAFKDAPKSFLEEWLGVTRNRSGELELKRDRMGLSRVDHELLDDWVGMSSTKLRKNQGFVRTLQRLPTFAGTTYRGTSVPVDLANQLLESKGKTFTMDRHSSASRAMKVAQDFLEGASYQGGEVPVLFQITQRSGRKVPDQAEKEVILMKGTKYKVEDTEFRSTRRRTGPGSYLFVKMKELK